MIPELRRRFLESWTADAYPELLRDLDRAVGTHIDFRVNETPVFLPRPLLDKMVRYGQELYEQLSANREYREASDVAIPAEFEVPNEAEHSLFVQADFGLVREPDGSLEPKLVEIQGFPSIYVLQCTMAQTYADTYRLEDMLECRLGYLLDGLDAEGFVDLMRRAIVGEHAPEDVVLLEIDPYRQKTAGDFLETQRLLRIRICPITEVRKRGRKLFYDGREIRRIYNRAIVDELTRKNVQLDFRFTDDLDVEWAGHPNWFFRLSKFSLPWLRHVSVPETRFLSEIETLPDDLENYVLKPLYSFAGLGVKVGTTRAEIEAIPEPERSNYILQKRMQFVPTVETPTGLTTIETRIMYIRDGGRLRPVTTVIRTGRGKMMGVDYNKNLNWVGASAGFYPVAAEER